MTALAHYQTRVANTPPAGQGAGFHGYLLGTANTAVRAGVSLRKFMTDMLSIAHRRPVHSREIVDAYNKASGDHQVETYVPVSKPKRAIADGEGIFQKLVNQGQGVDEADFWEASPIRIDWEPQDDPQRLLFHLYERNDSLYIGDHQAPGVLGETIRQVVPWGIHFESGGGTWPHIIPNPLTGRPAPKKSGEGETYRGDHNVLCFRLCTVEFDGVSHADQSSFWAAADLPICALIDTGGRSIHAWLDVRQLASVSNVEEWEEHIEKRLYGQVLIPLGVDAACKNPARLSRLPGHFRSEKQRWQRLLYLSPIGRKVFA